MTWFCRPCGKNNPPHLTTCRTCHKAWEQVWEPPKRRRSLSRWKQGRETQPPKEKKDKKVKKDKEDKPVDPVDPVFRNDLPWIISTPSSRSNPRLVTESSGAALPQVPPPAPVEAPPVLPPKGTATATLTSEETKQLAHLKGLVDLKCELPESMMAVYLALEEKSKAATTSTISHSQLNRLHKLRSQIDALATKVTAMDQQWASFLNTIMVRVRDHSAQYQQSRADLIANLVAKQNELKELKGMITKASASIAQAEAPVPDLAHPESAQQVMLELQQHQQMAQAQPVHLVDDDRSDSDMGEPHEMEDQEEEPNEEDELVADRPKPSPHTTYRGSPSPHRVANLQVKAKNPAKDRTGRARKGAT